MMGKETFMYVCIKEKRMKITLIAAMDTNMVIGAKGQIPWMGCIPKDMQHFRKHTIGKSVVMGRKTFESMGKALPHRTNIVLTRDLKWSAPDVTVCRSIADVMQTAHEDEIVVIGGSEIYQLFMPHATRMLLTFIRHKFVGDTWFPAIKEDDWVVMSNEQHAPDERNTYPLRFVEYVHK